MNVNWMKVVIASLFEVGWVIGLKHADGWLEWMLTIVAIVVSFYVMIMAGRQLPVGTVYAVFVGLGTAGTVLAEIVLFNETFSVEKLVMVGVLLTGVIGLKLVTNDAPSEGREA